MATPLLTSSSAPSNAASLSSSLPRLDSKAIPRHVAVIMDGNGRWATQRGLPRTEGHRRGAQSIQTVLQCCQDWGIEALTVYAFSTENWNRPGAEVRFLMGLFEQLLQQKLAALCQEGVRLWFVGNLELLPRSLQSAIQQAVAATAHYTGIRLTVALNYGGRHDIVRACRRVADLVQAGELSLEGIDEQVLSQHLDTADLRDPDLLIRTSGERRLSNFLLWQMAYTEMYFTETLWPDFDRAAFREAVVAYQQRDRRFGGVKA